MGDWEEFLAEGKGYHFYKSKKHLVTSKCDENKALFVVKIIDGQEVYRQKIPELLFRKITEIKQTKDINTEEE